MYSKSIQQIHTAPPIYITIHRVAKIKKYFHFANSSLTSQLILTI